MKFPFARQTIRQASLIIAVIAISSQALGIIREALIANYLGTSIEYDILLISMAVPMMIANILFATISSAGIPFLQRKGESPAAGGKILRSPFFKTNSLVILVISLIVFFTLPLFREILAKTLNESHIDKVIIYSRVFCLVIPIRAYEGIFRTLLQIRNNFLFPALTVFGFNIGIIIILVTLFPSIGAPAYIAAWMTGTMAQVFIVAIPSYILMKRNGNERAGASQFDSTLYLRYFTVIAFIESISLIVDPFDRYLAGSFLSDGFVSANYYGVMISTVPIRILIYAVGTAIFPALSERFANDRHIEAGRLYHKAITVGLVLIIPVAAYLFIFSNEIIKILLERGKFVAESRLMTDAVLKYYLVGIIFQALFVIQLKVAFAIKSKRYLIFSRLISFGVKAGIGLTFIKTNWALAIGGGTATMYLFSFIIMEYYLIRKSGLSYSVSDMWNIGKALISSAVTTGFIIGSFWVVNNVLDLGVLPNFIIVGTSGIIGFLLTERWFGITGFLARLKPQEMK